ncbi:HNH endonuclease [Paenibacillus barcinonensis]|nr:HNH endonuclease [Paenibacillus barcinonensis]
MAAAKLEHREGQVMEPRQLAEGNERGERTESEQESSSLSRLVASDVKTTLAEQTLQLLKDEVGATSSTGSQRKKRRRRRKRKPAEAVNIHASADAPAPEPDRVRSNRSSTRGGTGTGKGAARPAVAAKTSPPAASGRESTPHSSRNHAAGMDGRPRRHHAPPAAIDPEDPASLRTNRQGMVRMRGKTDKGRRWHQEVDMELAVTLVKEKAAVVVNRYTIRRLFSNKDFKRFILNRDNYTCYFCGSYGDTIDHLLPRAKGGHTTPLNCVCACNLCNQSKAAMDADEFMRSGIPEWNAAHQAELLELEMQESELEDTQ